MAKAKMTVEDARERKGALELTIKEALEDFTINTGIVITKLNVKLFDYDVSDDQLPLMEVDIYQDVDILLNLFQ